jgi:predicted  nucleic acid-binding Zn-ribbon protein
MSALPLDPDSDGRIGDYLDDKLQTLADLESLDGLLLAVRDQQTLLRKQLEDAQKDLEEAHRASVDHDAALKSQVAAFEKEQQDIDRRLKDITMSDTCDVAVRRFESSMEKLHKLDVAKGYVEVLQLVETASCVPPGL